MDQTTKRGRPSKLRLTDEQETEFIESKSHSKLAKKLGIKLSELIAYAQENGLDEESRLYWLDVAAERLKEAIDCPETETVNSAQVNALKSLLTPTASNRPGRPSEKKAFKQGMDAAQKDLEGWAKEVERMQRIK